MSMKFSDLNGIHSVTLPDGSSYSYQLPTGTHILIVANIALTASNIKKYSNAQTKGMLFRRKDVFDYKHYRRGGSKFYTYAPGLIFGYAIPLDQIVLVPEYQGYSYVKVLINGVEFCLNVSGSTAGSTTEHKKWVDYIGNVAGLSGTRTLTKKHLEVLASVSCDNVICDMSRIRTLDNNDLNHFYSLVAKMCFSSKLNRGNKLFLNGSYSFQGTKELVFESKRKQQFICTGPNNTPVRVSARKIDWVKTCELNGLNVPVIEDVNFCNQGNSNVVCS